MFTDNVIKVNSFNLKQDRVLILTTLNVYNFKKKQLKRKIPINSVLAITKNTKNDKEFVLHVPTQYDYRFYADNRDEFLDLLKLRFANLVPQKTLRVFGIGASTLKDFTTTFKD